MLSNPHNYLYLQLVWDPSCSTQSHIKMEVFPLGPLTANRPQPQARPKCPARWLSLSFFGVVS